MIITWQGEGHFKIQSGDFVLISDPLTPPRGKIDIIIRTLAGWPTEKVSRDSLEISGPGQYESKGASVEGWLLEKESGPKFIKTVYKIEADEIRMGFLGHLSAPLDPKIEAELKELDIVFIPAGGKPYLEPAEAAKLCRRLAPKIIIPGFYKFSGLKRNAETVQPFLKELGQPAAKPEEKFSFRKKDLTGLKMKPIILEV